MASVTKRASGIEKRGGYTGGGPASSMGPPLKVPSGAVKASESNGSSGSKK